MSALINKLQLLIVFLYPIFAIGQGPMIEWGQVPHDDRQMTSYDRDPTAIAVVLADCGSIDINDGNGTRETKYFLERHRRIKLLDKASFDQYGTIRIPFFHEDQWEVIDDLKAQTILPDGSVHKIPRKEFFTVKETDRWSTVSFAFPKLMEGAIIEWQYTLVSKEVIKPRTWYFQESIPVRYNEFKIRNESRISYVTLFNMGDNIPFKETYKDKTIYQRGDTRLVHGADKIFIENAGALIEESFITTLEDYVPKIRLQGEYYFRSDGSKEKIFTTWQNAVKSLLELPTFGGQFNRKKNYKKVLQAISPLIVEGMAPQEIVETVYDFLTKNVSYNGINRFTTDDNLNEAFTRQEASSGQLNMMCLALLKNYDLEAFPILTSTREHGQIYKEYPLMDQFNYLLVGVEIAGNIMLLDATDPLRPIKMPHPQVLNKVGWIVDKNRPGWIDITVPMCRDVYGAELQIDQAGNIKGKLRAVFNSYTALSERSVHQSDRTSSYWKERIERFAQEVVLDSVSVRELGGKGDKLMNEVYFSLPNGAMQAGDLIYISPVFYSTFSENPFKLQRREYPVDFSYPFEERYMASIVLPEGYEVEELPADADFELDESMASISYKASQSDNKIQIMLKVTIEEVTIPSDKYEDLKLLFDKMIDKRSEQIVLKKTSK